MEFEGNIDGAALTYKDWIDCVIQPNDNTDRVVQLEREFKLENDTVLHPLNVHENVYNIIVDMFSQGKSMRDMNSSCLELFADYPPNRKYWKLVLYHQS